MPEDTRVERILELIEQIFGDANLNRAQTRELLEIVQEDVTSRLEALAGDDDDRTC